MAKFKTVYKVQRLAETRPPQTSQGARIGRVWLTEATFGRLAVAERTAKNLRIDHHDGLIRVVEAKIDANLR